MSIDQLNEKTLQYLREVETVAQNLLTIKENKLELSNAKNKFRESLRALEQIDDRKTWMKCGNVFIERPTNECLTILRSEIQKADEDLNVLHEEIKSKLSQLRDLEHEPRLESVSLKPISLKEAKALHKAFGDF